VAKALERQARQLPVIPGEEGEWAADARLADALVAVCSARIAADADPDRATVVIHARLDRPGDELGSCEIEGGPAIHPEVARRFACNGRIQTVVEDESGIRFAWGASAGSRRTGCFASSDTAIESAPSPGAGAGNSPTPITSSGGRTAARPIWTTWSSCAASITIGARLSVGQDAWVAPTVSVPMSRTRFASMRMPGPMVVEMVTDFRYLPLAVGGLARRISSTTVR
jgi:hypothetical protein